MSSMTPTYAYFSVSAESEADLRCKIGAIRVEHASRFAPGVWQHMRVDRQLFLIDEEAIDFIQQRVVDTQTFWAIRYRPTPESQRLAAAQIKLNRLLQQLNQPGSHKHVERHIARQRNRITEIKYDLVHRSQGVMWMVGGLLPESLNG